ncbi:MAG: hypothetical protein RR846_06550 [Oscillospiraceae bacterium]
MNGTNVAYDLSIYEEQQTKSEEKEEQRQPAKLIKVKTGLNRSFKRMCNILSIAVSLSLVIAVLSTNASITSCTSNIAKKQGEIVELESENAYLNFSLESRMSLNNVEEKAVGALGMVKMDSAQVEYIEIEDENKIEVTNPELKDKLEDAMKPILSYLLP